MPRRTGNYQEQMPKMYAQALHEESADQKLALGTVMCLADGRRFKYVQDSGAGAVAGTVYSKDVTAVDCTIAAADVAFNVAGARKVTVTVSSTPTKNLYRDGWMVITAGAGIGEMYKIRGNTADDDPASGRFTLFLYDELATLHVASNTTISIYENECDGVIIMPSVAAAGTGTGGFLAQGVAQRIVTASYYYWLQTWGLASALLITSTSGTEDDERLLRVSDTSGSLESLTGIVIGIQTCGYLVESVDQANGEAALVYLTIS